ncbi:MAG: thermonuclease family protein [Nitrospinota bacterium]
MRSTSFRLFIAILSLGTVAGFLLPGKALPQRARVLSVTDGDTFKIGVRLIGVDAPETRHPRKPVQFYGKEAREFLRKKIAGKTIRLEIGREPSDRFGRLLGYVFLPGGVFLNALLVSEGYARASPHPPNLRHANLFQELERKARAQRKGMWSGQETKAGSRPPVVGNRKTRIYHTPDGLYYELTLKSKYRRDFSSEREAIEENYKKSKR